MVIYQTHELTFELPEALKDKSVNIFSLTDSEPSAFSLVISRDVLAPGEDLVRYRMRQRHLLQRTLPEFQVAGEEALTVGGHEAVLTDHRWRSPEGRMSQRQVAVAPPPSAAGPGRVLLVTATCEERLHAAWGSTFAAIVGSIRFRV